MIQFLQARLILEVNGKRIVLCLFTVSGSVVFSGPTGFLAILPSVELEVTHSKDGLGLGVDPEIDQVELVVSFRTNHGTNS
jgi:hypothetical protein